MIIVDTNMSFVINKLGISASKYMEKYANKTLDDIIEAETSEGNPVAMALAKELMENVTLVMEMFKLMDPENRLEILKQMTSGQMYLFLPLMEPQDLAQGLNFFSVEKLMQMIEKLPPEQLVEMALEMFPPEELIKLMPDEQLNKFLQENEIDKNKMLKHLMSIPPQYLAQMLEAVTGKLEESINSYELVSKLGELKPLDFKNALASMEPVQKQKLVLSLAKEHPEWLQKFDASAYTTIIEAHRDKADTAKTMGEGSIKQEELIKMVKELPNDLMAVLITQLDPKIFAETLMEELPEVMAEIMLM